MAETETKKRGNYKYNSDVVYKSVSCKCSEDDYKKFQKYANSQYVTSMNSLLYRCVMHCINNNVDLWKSESEHNENNKK